MSSPARSRLVLLAVLLAILGGLVWFRANRDGPFHAVYDARPRAVMGTDCLLVAVVRRGKVAAAHRALREAEEILRREEARLSTWIESSELGALNAAKAGEVVPLSAPSLEVLRAAKEAWRTTEGAFDVTCRPILELWRAAGRSGVLPTEEQLRAAREESRWEQIELLGTGARKAKDTTRVDLGGIAKGWAIDRALERMLSIRGVQGALVDVGGDIACRGIPVPDRSTRGAGRAWSVAVRDPWGGGTLGSVVSRDGGAVCTSGHYARFTEIEGRRYSHILDPRTLRPADAFPSVTVVGPSAMEADVWATALAVGGDDFLRRRMLPPEFEVVVVSGSRDRPVIRARESARSAFRGGERELDFEPLPR